MAKTGRSFFAEMSLGTRIFLVTSLLIALSVGAAVAVTSILIRQIARRAAAESLQSSSSMQAMFEKRRYQQLQLISRLFVNDPYLTAYVAEAAGNKDVRSILDQLGERQKDLRFDFAIVLDPSGRVIARTDNAVAAGQDLSQRPLVAKAVRDFEGSGVWREGDKLYYAVALPINKDFNVLGFVVMGFAIDDAAAREVNQVSGTDVAFVADMEQGPQVVATTLTAPLQQALTASLRSRELEIARALKAGKAVPESELTLTGAPWMALSVPLLDSAGHAVGATVTLASLDQRMAGYRQIEVILLVAGLAALLIAPLLAFAFTRQTLAPVRRLVAATEAARQGDYSQKVEVGRSDEVGKLAGAFDELLSDLREKRDMEAYVTDLSRNLPEPAGNARALGTPQTRDVLLLGVELRGYSRVRADGAPQQTLDRLALDLRHLTSAISLGAGQV
ncbi:MAG TPA: cache domain-containing protein, partial [Thermoanaerobaculia bacterium]